VTDGVWKSSPVNNDYLSPANWESNTPPDTTGEALFKISSITNLSIFLQFSSNAVQAWNFNAGTNYTFTILGPYELSFNGAGIVSFGGNATLIVEGSATLNFVNNSTAGNATITNSATLGFVTSSKAGQATISNSDTLGFRNTSSADSAVITTASGGTTTFYDTSDGGSAQFITQFGGTADFSQSRGPGNDGEIHAGSIAGAGTYHVGAGNVLVVGGNNLTTDVSGIIDGGDLVKVGSGTLRLSHFHNNLVVVYLGYQGGTLDVAAPGAAGGGINFDLTYGGSVFATLAIENAALSGHAFATPISYFAASDLIDLPGLPFAVGASANYNTATNVLSVASGGVTDTLTLNSTGPGTLVAYFDGQGGTAVGFVNHVTGTSGNDVLSATLSPDYFNGLAGRDLVSYAAAPAGVHANLANPTFNAGWAGGDRYTSIEGLIGSPFDDVLTANRRGSILRGGPGDDRLIGGVGKDKMSGGPGNDTFVFRPGFGHDVITDFSVGPRTAHDTIELHSIAGLANFNQVKLHSAVIGGHVVIHDNSGDTIALLHVASTAAIHGYDFHFLT